MSATQEIPWDELWAAARQASAGAYAPYSNLSVGAAALADDGRMVSGCNVENASYGLTLCAECGLVGDLHRSGGGRLVAVAVTDGDGNPLTPCGRCRQLLYEAGGASCLVNETHTVGRLLPGAFGPDDLP
ncbi:cytidine deaminase [Candidatus Poriferisocius sp.]|uniref:cytidine deaminase n=1 Tax=Candidatus Poriferisocius sp. TaxID=3101276 RepID=UPI003B019A02